MDLQQYYRDLRVIEDELKKQYSDGIVYVTSQFHRERNSTPGNTLSASWRNAARVITDGTHRLSTQEEVKSFYDHQEAERVRTTKMEQLKKKQYIVVVDQHEPGESFTPPVLASAGAKSAGKEK